MKLTVFVAVMVFWTMVASGAEVAPGSPQKGQEPAPETSPSQPAPPSLDPGIQRRPSTVPDPRSAVPPPNVDSEMAVNPETAPPAIEGGNTPRGPESKDKASQ